MGVVFLNVQGDGYAYCIPAAGAPLVDGERFEIYSVPYSGATLEDIRAFDSYDYSVAIPVAEHIVMTYRNIWNNLYVDIYFSGSPGPGPGPGPSPGPSSIPYWLLKKAADNNNKGKKLT